MFTGIIEALATVEALQRRGDGARLVVRLRWPQPAHGSGVALGDSVAIDGVCLTVVEHSSRAGEVRLAFDASHETLACTTLGERAAGSRVHVERALRVGDRLGGHWVTGHVDGLGTLVAVQQRSEAFDVRYAMPAALAAEVVGKGSVAIDGVSLTVNEVFDDGFRVTLIPHTVAQTTLLTGGPGKRVHLETDVLAKYVRRLVEVGRAPTARGGAAGGLTMAAFERAGFTSTDP